jgi:soluble lytic murein transglycosylase-like protein
MSAQPKMGQPNTNGNTALAPVNAGYAAGAGTVYKNDMTTLASASDASAPYSNTVGIGQQIGGSMNTTGQPIGKGVDSASSVKSGKT